MHHRMSLLEETPIAVAAQEVGGFEHPYHLRVTLVDSGIVTGSVRYIGTVIVMERDGHPPLLIPSSSVLWVEVLDERFL